MTTMANTMLGDIIYFDFVEWLPPPHPGMRAPDIIRQLQAAREIYVRLAAGMVRQGRPWRGILKKTGVSEQTLSDLQLWARLYPAPSILEIFAEIHARMPADAFDGRPTDGAQNYKHYLYGHPKEGGTLMPELPPLPEISYTFRIETDAQGRHSIATPFTFGDGDQPVIVLTQNQDGWMLSDRGTTLFRLGFQLNAAEYDNSENQRRLDCALAMAGIALHNGELTKPLLPDHYSDDLFNFIHALLKIDELGDFPATTPGCPAAA